MTALSLLLLDCNQQHNSDDRIQHEGHEEVFMESNSLTAQAPEGGKEDQLFKCHQMILIIKGNRNFMFIWYIISHHFSVFTN